MPRPIEGLVPVAEFGSAFEVDAAIALLGSHGIEATSSHDPALRSPAPWFASDRVFELVVRAEEAEEASAVLSREAADLPEEFRAVDPDDHLAAGARRRRKRAVGWTLVMALWGVPFLILLAAMLATLR